MQYEIYIYFDPRSQGDYTYKYNKFNYKPVYVGKGREDIGTGSLFNLTSVMNTVSTILS